MNKIIIIGSGGHAKVCLETILSTKKYKIIGFIDKKIKKKILDYKIIGNDEDLASLRKKAKFACLGIGQIKNFLIREKKFNQLKKLKFILPKIISSHAIVSKFSKIGEGTIVMHGAIIHPGAKIGKNCIINTNSIIEHDVEVKDNCHISTKAIINGNSTIEKNSFIGSGSVIVNNISVKKNSFIKAGSIITN
tara:strand:+ start:2534 stop:3109 length:576 start_codon:yes stop_codon:yes gene_type:complete